MTGLSAAFKRPHAVVFDWDNTLVSTWPVITEALNAARAAYGLETWSVAEARVKSARALRETFPEWFGENWQAARDLFYERFAAVHCERLVPMAGAESLLRFLARQEIPAFVVSNKKSAYLRAEIDHLGWTPLFVRVAGAGDAVRDKPDSAPTDLVLSGVASPRPGIWFVGDTHADVEGALRSGCLPVILHDSGVAEQFGVKLSFLDCHTMETALYSCTRSKGVSRPLKNLVLTEKKQMGPPPARG